MQNYTCNILPKQIQIELGNRQPKIPRPVNAFMLYANENRKKMARAYPLDSNKEISKRLGQSWKELDQEQKAIYYTMAKKVDAEHKQKYPDYVYNPKEARIRKAMRDASRERAMGAAPASRGGRRSQPWVLPEQEDQFIMNQSAHGMRGVGSPMCGTSFPIGNVVGNGQFIQAMPSYNKHIHLVSHDSAYIQTNPMAQLQHQTDMWHQYHQNANPIRPTTDQFMMPPQMPTYHQQTSAALESSISEKLKSPIENFAALNENAPSTTPHQTPRENQSSVELKISHHHQHPQQQQQDQSFEDKSETIIDAGNDNYNMSTGSLYQEEIVVQNPFDKVEGTKGSAKKKNEAITYECISLHEESMMDLDEETAYHKQYVKKYVESTNCDALQIMQDDGNQNQISFTYVTYPLGHENKFSYMSTDDFDNLYFIQSCENGTNTEAKRCNGMQPDENVLNLSKK